MHKLYLHIGTHKTGTTVIQHAIRMNRAELECEKIIFLNGFPDFREIMGMKQYGQDLVVNNRTYLLDMTNIYHGREEYVFLMSCEAFSGNPMTGYSNSEIIAKCLRTITKGFDVKILVYLRKQGDFVESLYSHSVATGETSSFNEYLERFDQTSFDWNAFLNGFSAEFGEENLLIRRYGKEYFSGKEGLVGDFSRVIGTKALCKMSSDKRVNSGMTGDEVEIVRFCNKYLGINISRKIMSALSATSNKQAFAKYSFFTKGERELFDSRYHETNKKVANIYFNITNGCLFDSEVGSDVEGYEGLKLRSIPSLILRVFRGIGILLKTKMTLISLKSE